MSTLPDPNLPWPVCLEAVALIAEKEGCRLRAYKCPAGVWTCGWGETEGVTPGLVWTQREADERLCTSLAKRVAQMQTVLTEHAEPNQLGALLSLQYNIGQAAFAKSTVLKAHNAGDSRAAARAFSLWDKAKVNGVLTVLAGLTARRAAEAALYLKPEPGGPVEPMVQAVASESPISASPIAQSGAVTVGAGAFSIVAAAGDQLGVVGTVTKQAKEIAVGTLGVPSEWFLPVLMMVVGSVVVWYRLKQRKGGWC